MQEEFRKINGYPNYSVSDKGNVRNDSTGKILKGFNSNGYLRVELTNTERAKKYRIHRLVADAFIPNPDNKQCVDHIDNNKVNNNVENLRWATIQENTRNMSLTGKNTSGYKGVSFNRFTQKWVASIKNNGRSVHIGSYRTVEEAALARQQVAMQLYGEYLNDCEKVVINVNAENVVINN